MKSVPYALCVTCAKCRLPQILAKIAPSPPNKWLTNRPLITNTANVTQEERMARSPQRLRAERLQIMLDGEELLALDDFRFKQRMPSRAAAVRELLKRGLAAEGFLSATAGTKSSEYGVIGKTPAGRQ